MRATTLKSALRAALMTAALAGLGAAVAPAVAAEIQVQNSSAVAALSSRIEQALLAAVAGAPLNADTLANATASVESVIAVSGADSGTVLAALSLAKVHLNAQGARDAVLALNTVEQAVDSTLISTSTVKNRPGHGPPPHPTPPPPPPPGHGGYRPPHH